MARLILVWSCPHFFEDCLLVRCGSVCGGEVDRGFEVERVSDPIIMVKLIFGQQVLRFQSVYATQCGLSDSAKDLFYDQLKAVTAMIVASEFLIPCGDWNGHVGSTGSGYKEIHGGYGYGKPDPESEGERILEYALAYDLSSVTQNKSDNTATQIDFVLFRKSLREGDSWRRLLCSISSLCAT